MPDEKILQIAKTFKTFEESFNSLSESNIENITFCLDDDGLWKRLELKWMLDYFQDKEEYEKCSLIKNLMDKYFIADESQQIQFNINLKLFLEKNENTNDPFY